MHEYYFKIKKGDIEFECSTTDKVAFEQKISDWINGLVNGEYIEPPKETPTDETDTVDEKHQTSQRSGFIEVKNLASINEIKTPDFSAFEERQKISSDTLNFEEALQESLENPKTEVKEKQEQLSEFEEYLRKYNPESTMDYLIVTAMFVSNIENNQRFSIKQLNAKLVPLTGVPIDHSMIQDSIEQNYLRVVPDLTGESELTEYELTNDGESYFVE